jgi:hypothetical protein
MARSRGSGRVRYRLQYRHTVRTRILTIITIGPNLTGLRGTRQTGSINYTLVSGGGGGGGGGGDPFALVAVAAGGILLAVP